MNGVSDIIISRKIKLLREKIDQQKRILLEVLEQWYYYRYVVQPRLLFEYEKVFGDLEEEIENKSCIALSLERKLELLITKVRRGMKVNRATIDGIDRTVQYEIRSRTIAKPIPQESSSPLNKFTDGNSSNSDEFNRMYRLLVKKLHPDIVGETDLFKKFWISIQDAYKEKNFQLMRIFFKTIGESNSIAEKEDSLDLLQKLEEELKELKLMIGIERRMVERMLSKEPFIFDGKFNDPKWIDDHRKNLKSRIANLDRQIDFNKRLLSKMEVIIQESYD